MFQFHTGSIKRSMLTVLIPYSREAFFPSYMFQFHTGSIKSLDNRSSCFRTC